MAPIDPAVVVFVLIGIGTAGVAILAWRQRPNPGAETLGVLMGSVAAWNGALLWATVSEGYTSSFLAANVVVVAAAVTVVSFLAFTLEYTGREELLVGPYVYLLGIEPVAVAVIGLTNELHSVFWNVKATATGYVFEGGPLLYAHIAFTYVVLALGTVLIVFRLYRSRSVHRRQAWAILFGVIPPWLGNVLYIAVDVAAFQVAGFVVTGVVAYWAITEYQLVDLTPVARATVMDALEVGVVVIDGDGRVTDLNRFGATLLNRKNVEPNIGSPAQDLFADVPELAERIDSGGTFETTATTTVDGEERIVSASATLLTDALDRSVGRLLLLEDITERERRRREIETQNERLEEFATMVSHDLRNPLDVASGHVELMRSSRSEASDLPGVCLETDRLDETAGALERIEAIVDDVLTLARDGRDVTDPEAISLRAAARSAWEHVDTADGRLVVGTDDRIVADRDRLERLFENLFRNSVEHGGSGVTVSVGIIHDGHERTGFYVADDGDGIPAELREDIFESGVTGESDGTGFGLAIVEQLADVHGWTIDATESDEGGARFEFTSVDLATEAFPEAD